MAINDENEKRKILDLVEKAKRGDRKASETLINLHRVGLYKYCCYLTKNTEKAQDLVHKVLVH